MEHFHGLADLVVLFRQRAVARQNGIVNIFEQKNFVKGVGVVLLQNICKRRLFSWLNQMFLFQGSIRVSVDLLHTQYRSFFF